MDGERFDLLTRSLGGAASRRSALAGLIASTLTGSLLAHDMEHAAAKKHHHHHHHKKHKHHGGGGGDACPEGQTDCGNGQCADPTADPNNCGTCGNVCDTGKCSDGVCICVENADCPAGQTCCTNFSQCFDLLNDHDHCGLCTVGGCRDTEVCANGLCGTVCTGDVNCTTGNDCHCHDRLGASGSICAKFVFTDCESEETCTSDADCGFREACVNACEGNPPGRCLEPCD